MRIDMNMTHNTTIQSIMGDDGALPTPQGLNAENTGNVLPEETPQSMGSSGALVSTAIVILGVFFLFVCLASFIRIPVQERSRARIPLPQPRRKMTPEEIKLLFIIIELMITTRKVIAIVPADENNDLESNDNNGNDDGDDKEVYIHLTYPMKKRDKKITRRSLKEFEDADSGEGGGTTIHAPHLMPDNDLHGHESTTITHEENETTDDENDSDSCTDDEEGGTTHQSSSTSECAASVSSSLSVPDGTDDTGDLTSQQNEEEQLQQQLQQDTSPVSDHQPTLPVDGNRDDEVQGVVDKEEQHEEERVEKEEHEEEGGKEEEGEHVQEEEGEHVQEEEGEHVQEEEGEHVQEEEGGHVQEEEEQEQSQVVEEEAVEEGVVEQEVDEVQYTPVQIQQQEAAQRNISNEPSCVLCFDEYEVDDEVCFSCNPECIHVFHKDCIVEWLARSPYCPCCKRQYLDIDLTPMGGAGAETETEQSSTTATD